MPAIAGVAGRHYHHDPGADQLVDLDAQGALAAGEPLRLKVVADTHVDPVHPQAAAVAVELLDVLDGGDEVAGRPGAVLVEYLEAEELAPWGHAGDLVKVDHVVGHLAVLVAAPSERPDFLGGAAVLPAVAQLTGDD